MEEQNTSSTEPARRPRVPPHEQLRDRFRSRAAASLEAGLVRYSRRRELLRVAERMGLTPFEANLIIAEVQYGGRRTDTPLPETLLAARRAPALRSGVALRRRWPMALIAGVVALTIIWYLLR